MIWEIRTEKSNKIRKNKNSLYEFCPHCFYSSLVKMNVYRASQSPAKYEFEWGKLQNAA